MNWQSIRQRLLEATTVAKVEEMSRQLLGSSPEELFQALFPVAIANRLAREAGQVGARPVEDLSWRAGHLLVDLDPRCPVSCEEALRMIVEGSWDVSLKEVPFYLISQFGKLQLVETVSMLREGASPAQTAVLESMAYWLSPPTIVLLSTYRFGWEDDPFIDGE